MLQFQRINDGSALPVTQSINNIKASPKLPQQKAMSPSTSKNSISKNEHHLPLEAVEKGNSISPNGFGFSIDHTNVRNVESLETGEMQFSSLL